MPSTGKYTLPIWSRVALFVLMAVVAVVSSTWALTYYVVRNNEMDRCERQLAQARHAAAVDSAARVQECSRALTALQAHLTQTCDKAIEARLAALGERVSAALRQGAEPIETLREASVANGVLGAAPLREAIAIDQDGTVLVLSFETAPTN